MNHPILSRISSESLTTRFGFVRRVMPYHIEASGPLSAIGDICEIECEAASDEQTRQTLLAEVAAVEAEHVVLIPFDFTSSILPDAKVTAISARGLAPVGDNFSGRLIDALARPLDDGPAIEAERSVPFSGKVLSPLERLEASQILETGLRAIDGLLPIGRGQRIGVFAASGVGKTTLIQQLVSQIECDRCVLCLVGERGREVETIWRSIAASPQGERFTCVAATSDVSAALRAKSVSQALCLAEYWRSKGEHVLLVVDSITRLAMAMREIGLAAGAPPTQRAYTPNVFSALPRIVERCGGSRESGSITAIMTVLAETDQVDDPIVEVMKSLLDGHVVLARPLADQGHFPAIDIGKSVSRQSEVLMTPSHQSAARTVRAQLAEFEESRVMVESGIYKTGTNVALDRAISNRPAVLSFLQQRKTEHVALTDTFAGLSKIALAGQRS